MGNEGGGTRGRKGGDCIHLVMGTMQERAKQDAETKKMRLKYHREIRNKLLAEKLQSDHKKHYRICREVLLGIVDLSTKLGEYRELTEK